MRVVVAGGVISTLVTLESLIKHKIDVVGVLGFEPISTKNVSGYRKLDELSASNQIDYKGFQKINSRDVYNQIVAWNPDILFVVGLSQLVGRDILNIPKLGTIGFHPTVLPKGRGRAPIAWLILEEKRGAASFFLMDEGTDSGPIFVQEVFDVSDNDYAEDVENKIINCTRIALDRWLPKLKKGEWNPIPQLEDDATYYGRRTPLDGHIDWKRDAHSILKLIRSSSYPHPGAFTFFKEKKLVIWRASLEEEIKIRGVVSRILLKDAEKGLLIQTGSGLMWLENFELYDIDGNKNSTNEIKVGSKLGYNLENEIYKLLNLLKQKDGL